MIRDAFRGMERKQSNTRTRVWGVVVVPGARASLVAVMVFLSPVAWAKTLDKHELAQVVLSECVDVSVPLDGGS